MNKPFNSVEDDVDGWGRSLLIAGSLVCFYALYCAFERSDWTMPKGGFNIGMLCLLAAFAFVLLIISLFASDASVELWTGSILNSNHFTAIVLIFLLACPVYIILRPLWNRNRSRELGVPPKPRSSTTHRFGGR